MNNKIMLDIMRFGALRLYIIASVYVKALVRNTFFYLYLMLIATLLPILLELPNTPCNMLWEVLGPDYVTARAFLHFVLFATFALFAAIAFDAYVILKLHAQPSARIIANSVYLGLINLIVITPMTLYILYVVWIVFPHSFAPVMTLYAFLLSLSLAFRTVHIGGVFALLAAATALSVINTSQTFAIATTILALAIWTFRTLLPLAEKAPRVIILHKINHATIGFQGILYIALAIIAIISLIYYTDIETGVEIIQKHLISGMHLTSETAFTVGIYFAVFVLVHLMMTPALLNLANRYVDAYVWYLRAILGINWRERVTKVLFYYAVYTPVVLFIFLMLKWLGVLSELGYVLTLSALGTVVFSIVMTKLEENNLSGVIVYFFLYFGIAYILDKLEELFPLSIKIPAVGLYIFDVAFSALLLTAAIVLYDTHIKLKELEFTGVI